MTTRIITPSAYRALDDPINDEGPWGIMDNPARPFYPTRNGVIRFIGLHITAGLTDLVLPDVSADNVVKNWGASAANTGASWHGTVDSDSIVPGLPDWYTAWVQGVSGYSFNSHGIGLEIGRREADWRSNITPAWKDATIRNAAIWAAPRVIRYKIPLVLIRNRETLQNKIMAGQPAGFAYHGDLAPHNRRDPGLVGSPPSWIDTFPIDLFFKYTAEEVARRTGGSPAPAPVPASTVYEVTAEVLNTRSGPGTNYSVVGTAPKGTRLVGTGKVSGDWVQARTPYQVQKNLAATWWNKAWLKIVSAPTPATTSTTTRSTATASYPVLRVGSTGAAVKSLQAGLMKTFPAYAQPIVRTGGADGNFGQGTAAVVAEFQRRVGLTPDAVVGPRTWTQLGKYGIRP